MAFSRPLNRGTPGRDHVVDELASLLRPDTPGAAADPPSGWPALLDLAAEHRLHPALWSELRRKGVGSIPPHLRGRGAGRAPPLVVLEDAYEQNAPRVIDLRRQALEAISALRDASIQVMPIKGGHWLLADWLPDPAARTTVDLDLLVDPRDGTAGLRALEAIGYRSLVGPTNEWADHQLPPLIHADHLGAIEVHTAPLWSLHGALIGADELWSTADTVQLESQVITVPSPTLAVTLLAAHAQLQDLAHRFRQVPLRALYDLATLARAGRIDGVDWSELSHRFDRIGERRALAAFAMAAEQWFGLRIPVDRRGGGRWVDQARRALNQPARADLHRRLAMVPLTFNASRMDRLHGSRGPVGRSWARLVHLARGGQRRLGG